MADINQSNWSETDSSNNATAPNGWTSGSMLPSQVEPTARAMMGALKRFYDHINATVTSGGTANAQTLTYPVAPTALVAGDAFAFIVGAGLTNTGDATLNINSLGAVHFRLNGAPFAGGELSAGTIALVIYDGTYFQLVGRSAAPLLRSYLAGLTLSNDGTTPNSVLDIAPGQAADSTNAVLISLGAFTKSTAGAWASGSGSNGMGNGLTIAASTWYHVILANNGGTPDIYFDTSVTGANLPSGISDTKVRRIGSFKTDASAHILAFSQNGDEFLWATPLNDVNTSTLGTAATLFALTVPTGVKVNALLRGTVFNSSTIALVLLTSPDETSAAANAVSGNVDAQTLSGGLSVGLSEVNIRTNTSAQIRAVSSAASTGLVIATKGWVDRRGRDN